MTCLTQMHFARQGTITPQMQRVAEREGLPVELVRDEVARGRLIIPANVNHLAKRLDPMAIGKVAGVKINANIGNSAVESNIDQELEKLHHAVHYGADTVMDLSTGGDIDAIRQAIIDASPVPIGTVPIYQAVTDVKQVEDLTEDDLLDHVEQVVLREILDLLHVGHRLIDRHGADRHRRGVDDRLADRVDVAARGQVHHRVGAVVDGMVQLLELLLDVRLDGRVADVGVDLHAGHLADRHRIEPFREVVHVRGDDEAPAGDLVTDELDRERFPLRDASHLGGDGALAGEMHLREAGHTELPSPVRTGSGSKGVISARAFMNEAAGTPVVGQSNVAAAPSHLPGFGWPVALAGLVHLLPLRAERERVDPARAIESQDAIQVVDLVLQQLRHRSLDLHGVLLALRVGIAHHDLVGPVDANEQVGKREAIVPHEEVIPPHVRDLGIDHGPALLVHLDEHDPHRRADLRRREGSTHLVFLLGDRERIPQIVRDEPRGGGLRVLDPLAADPQDRIAQLANASYGHGPPIWGFGGGVQLAIT